MEALDVGSRNTTVWIGLISLALALMPISSADAQTAGTECTDWSYNREGGLNGDEVQAWTDCSRPGAEVDTGLYLTCEGRAFVGFFVYDDDTEEPPEGYVETTFDFGQNKVYLYSVYGYEDSYASFISMNDYANHPVLEGLMSAPSVEIKIKGMKPIRIDLGGSRWAIEKMLEDCLEQD